LLSFAATCALGIVVSACLVQTGTYPFCPPALTTLPRVATVIQALQAFETGLALNPDNKEFRDRVRDLRRQARGRTRAAPTQRRGDPGPPPPDAWAVGLGERQYEWFVDCYRWARTSNKSVL
jgi:hypothetical protein